MRNRFTLKSLWEDITLNLLVWVGVVFYCLTVRCCNRIRVLELVTNLKGIKTLTYQIKLSINHCNCLIYSAGMCTANKLWRKWLTRMVEASFAPKPRKYSLSTPPVEYSLCDLGFEIKYSCNNVKRANVFSDIPKQFYVPTSAEFRTGFWDIFDPPAHVALGLVQFFNIDWIYTFL